MAWLQNLGDLLGGASLFTSPTNSDATLSNQKNCPAKTEQQTRVVAILFCRTRHKVAIEVL